MATPTLPQHPSFVIITLARREARLAVKEQLKAQGPKPQYMHASEINRAAEIYLEANARALLEVAWSKVQRSSDLMKFYEKEQPNSSSSAFASFRSRVSKPSVNQPYTTASSSRACCVLSRDRQSRAHLALVPPEASEAHGSARNRTFGLQYPKKAIVSGHALAF
jgi:hypothetical protein